MKEEFSYTNLDIISERVKLIRNDQGDSILKLSHKIGAPYSSTNRVCAGKSKNLDILAAIANLYNINIGFLVGIDTDYYPYIFLNPDRIPNYIKKANSRDSKFDFQVILDSSEEERFHLTEMIIGIHPNDDYATCNEKSLEWYTHYLKHIKDSRNL